MPLDVISYSELKDRQQLTLTDFTLEDGSAAPLELTQFNVFTADARVVVGTSTGDIPMERPEVALFRGHIPGEPDSHVFLSVSPFGVYGAIDRIDRHTRDHEREQRVGVTADNLQSRHSARRRDRLAAVLPVVRTFYLCRRRTLT